MIEPADNAGVAAARLMLFALTVLAKESETFTVPPETRVSAVLMNRLAVWSYAT